MNGVPWWFFLNAKGAFAGHQLTAIDPDGSIAQAIPTTRVIGCVLYITDRSRRPAQGGGLETNAQVINCKGSTAHPFFTIGHSTRTVAEFVDLLIAAEIRLVVDVRTTPRSCTNPQYNRDVLPETLSQFKVGYEHVATLGGLRGEKQGVSPIVNAFCVNAERTRRARFGPDASV